ncbi:MAG: hypothetical protein KHX55_04815 [Proteobacteria bacterium]|nr:hypothetical protein [Pseudomonadota bacterium]
MSTSLGCSSELYYIDPQDIIALDDAPASFSAGTDEEVSVLIRPGAADCLLNGRITAEQAAMHKMAYIPVRIFFQSVIPLWNLPAIFIKPLRQNYKFASSRSYHMSLAKLRELKIERGFRNAENAYKISKRWHISDEQRIAKYNQLLNSLKKGYDDNYPINIMLCRRMGVKDCVDDGHHRIGICVEYNIDRIAVCFRAAGRLPRWLQKLLLRFF